MNYIHKYTTCIIQYLYIYIMISSAGMALPAYIGNDNFIILTLLMGIYYVLKKKTLFHLQKQYLLFIRMLVFFNASSHNRLYIKFRYSTQCDFYTINHIRHLQNRSGQLPTKIYQTHFLYCFNQYHPLYYHAYIWLQFIFKHISTSVHFIF